MNGTFRGISITLAAIALIGACSTGGGATSPAATSSPAAASEPAASASEAPAASASEAPAASAAAESAAAPGEGFRLGVLFPGDAPYLAGYQKGLESAAADRGAELIVVNAGWKADVQATQMDELLAQKPDGIVLWAVDAKAICPALAKAKAANIPIVATNSEVDPSCADLVNAYTGPNDVAQGEQAADLINEALGGKGNVLVIMGVAGTAPQIRRLEGFEKGLAEVAPDIKILDKQPADWDKTKAINVTRDLLTRHGDKVNGIFGQDDTLAVGAAQAASDAGKEDVKVVGLGGSGDGLKAVEDGVLYGTMIQSPVLDGEYGVNALVNILEGKDQPATQYLEILPVTKENVGDYEPEW